MPGEGAGVCYPQLTCVLLKSESLCFQISMICP